MGVERPQAQLQADGRNKTVNSKCSSTHQAAQMQTAEHRPNYHKTSQTKIHWIRTNQSGIDSGMATFPAAIGAGLFQYHFLMCLNIQ